MFDEIVAVFPNASKPDVVFAWGNTIYSPSSDYVSPEIMAHEIVHGGRQGQNVEAWWARYLADPAFRLAEEIPAHQAEFRAFSGKDRNARMRHLHFVANRLSGPLYGSLISPAKARSLLLR